MMSDCEVEFADLFEVTDARFVEDVVVSKEVSLADMALSKTVKNRPGNVVVAVANRIDNRLALARKLVRVRSVFECQRTATGDDATVRRDLERLRHWRIQLRRLCLMTVDARLAADVPNAVWVEVRSPVGEDVLVLSVTEDANQHADYTYTGDSI